MIKNFLYLIVKLQVRINYSSLLLAIGLILAFDLKNANASQDSFTSWRTKITEAKKLLDSKMRTYDALILLDQSIAHKASAEGYFLRGLAYIYLGKCQSAILDLNKSLKLNENNSNGYYNRGICHASNGNHQQAISDFGNAIRINPKHEFAYGNRGVSFIAIKNYLRAESDLTKVIVLNNKSSIAYFNRVIARFAQGKIDLACLDKKKSVNLDSTYSLRLDKIDLENKCKS